MRAGVSSERTNGSLVEKGVPVNPSRPEPSRPSPAPTAWSKRLQGRYVRLAWYHVALILLAGVALSAGSWLLFVKDVMPTDGGAPAQAQAQVQASLPTVHSPVTADTTPAVDTDELRMAQAGDVLTEMQTRAANVFVTVDPWPTPQVEDDAVATAQAPPRAAPRPISVPPATPPTARGNGGSVTVTSGGGGGGGSSGGGAPRATSGGGGGGGSASGGGSTPLAEASPKKSGGFVTGGEEPPAESDAATSPSPSDATAKDSTSDPVYQLPTAAKPIVRLFDSTNFPDKPNGEGATLAGYEPIFEVKLAWAPYHPTAHDTARRMGLWITTPRDAVHLAMSRVGAVARAAQEMGGPVMVNVEVDIGTDAVFNPREAPTQAGADNIVLLFERLREWGFDDLPMSNWGTWVQTATDEMLATQDWVCVPAYHFPETEKLPTFFRRIDEAVELAAERVPNQPLGVCLSPRDNKNDTWLPMETWEGIIEHTLTYRRADRPLWIVIWGGPLLTYAEGEPYTDKLLEMFNTARAQQPTSLDEPVWGD